jgi:hypothetical protein
MSALLALFACAASARASIVDSTAAGFHVQTVVWVEAEPRVAYDRAVRGVARWWDRGHTYSGVARNLSIDARPGGCFCEKIPPAGAIEHLSVVYVQRGQVIRMLGGLGPLQELGASGALTWQFERIEGRTRITWSYRVAGYSAQGLDRLAPIVDEVLGLQAARQARYVDER